MDDDELDLESVIRELEQSDDDYSDSMDESDEFEDDEIDLDEILREMDDVDDVEFDTELDEILREMGYGDTEETDYDVDANEQLQHELDEAYGTIKSLRKTINEVNLLNAKLLYANRLFRNYNLNNEQKVKVVENLDRTTSVREVKLVYATLAESMKFSGTGKRGIDKRAMVEGLASRAVASTAPKREIISESNQLANRFKKLAGII
jgi:hypothetical protein